MKEDIKENYTRITDVLYHFTEIKVLKVLKPEVLENAKERGTELDRACKAQIMGLGTFVSENHALYLESFNLWAEGKKFLMPERLYCDAHKITGEPDLFYQHEEGWAIADIKATSKQSPTWQYQLSAYAYLAELAGFKITKIESVRLNKEGKLPEIHIYERDFDEFLNMMKVAKKWFLPKTKNPDEPLDYL